MLPFLLSFWFWLNVTDILFQCYTAHPMFSISPSGFYGPTCIAYVLLRTHVLLQLTIMDSAVLKFLEAKCWGHFVCSSIIFCKCGQLGMLFPTLHFLPQWLFRIASEKSLLKPPNIKESCMGFSEVKTTEKWLESWSNPRNKKSFVVLCINN